MIIKITIDDIRNAKEVRRKFDARETWHYSRAEVCPVAFALQRMYPNERYIAVTPWRIQIGERQIELSEDVASFISETDKKKDRIRPRELEIAI